MPSPPDDVVHLSVGDVELDIDLDCGARACRWVVGGHSLLASYGVDPVQHGMYPMAPWAGRVRGNRVAWAAQSHDLAVSNGGWALHGTTFAARGIVREETHDSDRARVVVRFADHPGWPWPMSVDVTWDLAARELTTTIEVRALVESFPVVTGWHPWFRRRLAGGQVAQWSLGPAERLVRGDDHLPTGERVPFDVANGPFDDAFSVPDGRASIRWPGAIAVDVTTDGGWYVVFDELPPCVCIEPQSGPPDGLRDGYGRTVDLAEPGRPHRLVTTWTMRDLPADRA